MFANHGLLPGVQVSPMVLAWSVSMVLSTHISRMSATDVQVHMAVVRKNATLKNINPSHYGFLHNFSYKWLQMACY